MTVKYYEGRRVFLRPLELSDEPLLRQWLNDPANWKTLNRWLPLNEVRERRFIEKAYESETDIPLGIVVRQGERLIGVSGLHRINLVNRSALFGIVVGDREQQSRGYGTEATRLMVRYGFRELNLNRIGLTVYANNLRAIRAYRRAGFVEEGRSRQAFYRSGSYHDELHFGILRSEWEDRPEEFAPEAEAMDTETEATETAEVCAGVGDEEDPGNGDSPVGPLASMTTWDTTVRM